MVGIQSPCGTRDAESQSGIECHLLLRSDKRDCWRARDTETVTLREARGNWRRAIARGTSPVAYSTCYIRSKKKPFGLSSSASFSLSGELSHRSRRGIVLVHKRKHGDMGSRPSRKARSGCRRELQKASSDTTLLAGGSSSTSLPLAHVVPLQAAQR